MTIEQAMELAMKHFQADDLNVAASIYREVLANDPRHAAARHMLGLVWVRQGEHAHASEEFKQAVELDPASAMFHCNLGTSLATMDLLEPAAAALRKAIELQPDYPRALANLGYVLQRSGQLLPAIEVFARVHALVPKDPQLLNDLGNALRADDQVEAAIDKYRAAIELVPTFPASYNNLAVALLGINQPIEAEKACRTALSYQPDLPLAHYNLGISLLTQGKYAQGWKEYAWRKRVEDKHIICRDFPKPLWNGRELNGKRILIHIEQGLGDAIQFARFLPMVSSKNGKIVFDCKPELIRLFQSNFEIEQFVATGDTIPPFDVHCPLLNLPMVLGATLETIPAAVPYLRAPADAAEKWRNRLASLPGLKVGLAWAGSETHVNDHKRSLPLKELEPLGAVSGVSFISLQKGPAGSQTSDKIDLLDWAGELSDFADTAALISNLDLVIAVDTAVAHLAGALAKPVWILLPFNPDWRWMLERTDSPWYPTMKLFRQQKQKDWSNCIRSLLESLDQLVRSATSSGSKGSDESAAGS